MCTGLPLAPDGSGMAGFSIANEPYVYYAGMS